MKRTFLMALVCLVCGCSPQAYTMLVESRNQKAGGLDISGKTVSILYLEPDNSRDSAFVVCFSDGLAQGLEAEYFKDQKAIEVYKTMYNPDGNYVLKDTLVNLMLQTGTDVMFLVDVPQTRQARVYAYDAMGKDDKVLTFVKDATAVYNRDDKDMFESDAQYLGYDFSKTFNLKWEEQSFTLVYFDNMDSNWTDAIFCAEDFQWQKAVDLWLTEVDRKNEVQASCAGYNIAVGCYMLGQYELALKWLDFSDSKHPVSLSSGLRKRIAERK